MTDAEWNSWQSHWTKAAGPLPDVRSRAEREALTHRFANVVFFSLIAFTLAVALPAVAGAREPEVKWIGVMIVGFFAAMAFGYLLIQRGVRADKTGSPRDALAFLEQRLRVERQVAHLVRWAYLAMFAAFLFVFPRLVAHHDNPSIEKAVTYPWMLVVLLVTFSAPWWVARRNRKHEEEIAQWRQWMERQQL